MARDAKYGLYVIPNENRDYEEEPIFIIRGKDIASVEAIRSYGMIAVTKGAKIDLLADCFKRADEFREWQDRNSDIVKVPD